MEEEKKNLEVEEPTEVLGNTDVIEPVTEEPVTEPVVEAPVVEEEPVVEETPVVEEPAAEPVVEQPIEAAPEVPAEPVAEPPVEPAPVEQPVEPAAPAPTPEEPKKEEKKGSNKLLIIIALLVLVLGGGYAVWTFVLGGNGSKEPAKKEEEKQTEEKQGKDESKEEEKQPEEEKEEESETTPTEVVEVTKEEAEKLLSKYALEQHRTSTEYGNHCGKYVRLFKSGGSSLDDYTEYDRQLVILANLFTNNRKESVETYEFTLDQYIEQGKQLFGSGYEAKIAKNSGSMCLNFCGSYEYDENTKVITVKLSQGGGSCSPGSYNYSFVSGKNDGKMISLEYKVLFSNDVEDVNEFIKDSTLEEKGHKYVLTFIKDGDNFIFYKGE